MLRGTRLGAGGACAAAEGGNGAARARAERGGGAAGPGAESGFVVVVPAPAALRLLGRRSCAAMSSPQEPPQHNNNNNPPAEGTQTEPGLNSECGPGRRAGAEREQAGGGGARSPFPRSGLRLAERRAARATGGQSAASGGAARSGR